MTNVAELLVQAISDHGIKSVWGVVGDALNPITDAIRRDDELQWIGVRHEEVAAFAASSQAQLTDDLAVCMGTVGPGAIHLLNGLYDAKKSRAPVLAICGQVPREDIGTDFFQEVDNQALFADVSVFHETLTNAEDAPALIAAAGNAALRHRGVAVLTIPGDVGSLDVADNNPVRFDRDQRRSAASSAETEAAAAALNAAERVTLLVGHGARHARDEVLQLAATLQAPIVLTLKAKEILERDNPYEIGQSGLIGNPATAKAFKSCDTLVLVGTDFPYRDFLPDDKVVIQLDVEEAHIGRRIDVHHRLVGDTALTLRNLLGRIVEKSDTKHLDAARRSYQAWRERQAVLTDPDHDRRVLGALRSKVDNADGLIRPELVAAALDRHAARDATFTTDTGMATVWLARFVRMSGTRRLIGSFNLGSMANAMPQALGAAALDPQRQVVAFCGDGGISMLMGDLITAVTYKLPVKLVVFNNGRLGMVKLEMEQVGLPEFGTELHNPDFAEVAEAIGLRGIRVSDPHEVEAAVQEALQYPGPVLLDVLTNPSEIAIPPTPTVAQGWGFAIAKTREFLNSHGEEKDDE